MDNFQERNLEYIAKMQADSKLQALSDEWFLKATEYEYSYHFTWAGLPIIQFPQDIVAMQELIFTVKPDLIIETGVARGGSLAFYASMLKILGNNGKALGIEIDLREANKEALNKHFLKPYIEIIDGSSIAPETITKLEKIANNYSNPMLILDSNHTHEHVYKELTLLSKFVKKDSYIVVFDTMVEHMPDAMCKNRPWSKGNSPMTALQQFLAETDRFAIDNIISAKLQISEARLGYLKCIK